MLDTINIAICEDNKIQVELLEKQVKKWASKNNIIVNIEVFYSGEAFSHNIEINTKDEKFTTRKNIGTMEKELGENSFIRCHRSYIVSLKHVKRIGRTEIELDDGRTIPVSRRQYSNVNMAFIKYYKGEANE